MAAVAVFAAAGGKEQLSGECVGGSGVEGAIVQQVELSLRCVSSHSHTSQAQYTRHSNHSFPSEVKVQIQMICCNVL